MKILIIRFSSFGDVVLTSPIIRVLKKQLPNAEIHFLIKSAFVEVISDNPNIDFIHSFHNIKSSLESLKKQQFDYIIDLHKNLRSKTIAAQIKGKYLTFNKLNIKKWMYVNLKINLLPKIHIVDRYFKAVEKLKVKNDFLGLDFYINPKNEIKIEFENYVCLCISAKHETKKLPEHKLIELTKSINANLVLLGGKEDIEIAAKLSAIKHLKIKNYVGKTNMQQTASIIKNATKVVCFDTAMMHIAAAFQKNITSIWGNTVPAFGMFPYLIKNGKLVEAKNQNIIENNNLNCRPCSKIGYKTCPKKHFKCMNDLSFENLKF